MIALHRFALACFLLLNACATGPEPLHPRPFDAVRIASYNVHYIILSKPTGSWSVGDWDRRKGPLDKAFKALDADVIGFQEMESFSHGSDGSTNLALDWLREKNPDYGVAAVGDWREFPSTQPIFYRRARIEAVDQGWFFFSDTPDVIYSPTFNGSYPAYATWATFRERKSGERFTVFNLHTDFSSGSNQRLSAALVADRARPRIEAGERVFIIGDLNASQTSRVGAALLSAGVTYLPISGSTYHWNRGLNLTGPVDHLAYSAGIDPLGETMVVRRKFDGEWPTDHFPIFGDFKLE